MTRIKSKPLQSPKPSKAPEAAKTETTAKGRALVPQMSGASRLEAARTSSPTPSGAPVGTSGTPADPKDMAIVCPVLGSLIAEGKVPMTPDGKVKIDDLRRSFGNDIGFTADHVDRAAGVGRFANKLTDVLKNAITQEFNVLDMRAGLIQHQGDSAILTGGQFDQGKFDKFVSHAKDGVMTEDSFAAAIATNYLRDFDGKKLPANRAKDTAAGEFGALLIVFGTKDPATGKMGIPVKDLLAMFRDKDLPQHMRATSNKDVSAMKKIVETRADAYLADSAFRSTATATGLATAGARLADGRPDGPSGASAQAAASAGKAANCPHMNAAAKMPTRLTEIAAAHGAS